MDPPDPESVGSLEDFIGFARALSRHFELRHDSDEWQQWNIGHYLEALASWLEDSPGPFMLEEWREIDRESPTWRGVAIMLDAARVYE